MLRNECDLTNPCNSHAGDFFLPPYRTLSSERRCLAEASIKSRFFLLRGKLRFLQIFISVAWLLPMNVFKLEGFVFFFQNFPKDVFGRKFLFPWGRNGDAKVVFFLAGSFSRNRKVFKADGLIRWIFIFLDIQMLMEKPDVFKVGPDTWGDTRNKAHVQFFDV